MAADSGANVYGPRSNGTGSYGWFVILVPIVLFACLKYTLPRDGSRDGL